MFVSKPLGILALLGGLAATALGAAAPAPSVSKIDFNRDIRPVLADKCFSCHGPDENGRKAKLRLDNKEGAFAPAKSGQRALVPGDLERSTLITRIRTHDTDDIMPPPKSGKSLTTNQIDLLVRWVKEGANWSVHWAFEPAQRPQQPKVSNPKWPKNDIDRFILAKLDKEGIEPAPEAPKATLLRRASIDLTGLPPTVEELDAFLADKSPQAYEKVVDRLLASPRYGENMARTWMDTVRYADSHGYHIDSQRDIWAYRDWVIKSFNQNKGFDAFTTEQLAGDMLPAATVDQKIGSGFIRCNMSTGEGGAIESEYAAKYAFDRVETTGTVWLGLTLVCARCHTHKYDPVLQKEYYGLYAFFNNLDEPVMDGNRPNPDPFLKLPSQEQSDRLDWLKKHVEEGTAKAVTPDAKLDGEQAAWAAKFSETLAKTWAPAAAMRAASTLTNGATLRSLDDKSVLAEGPNPEQDVYELDFKPGAGELSAIRIEAIPHASLPKEGSGRGQDGTFRLSEAEIELVPQGADGKPGPAEKLNLLTAADDGAAAEQSADRAMDGNNDTAWSPDASAAHDLHAAVFALKETRALKAEDIVRVRLRFQAGKASQSLGRFRISTTSTGDLARFLHPPKLEAWQLIGPFKSEGLTAGYAKVYEPETALDLKKAFPGVREEIRWNGRGDLEDNKTHLLVSDLHGVHGVYYMYRTLNLPRALRMDFRVRADDLFKVWVDGKLVMERAEPPAVEGVSMPGNVELAAGEHRILVKIVNYQGAKYFSFERRFNGAEDLPPEVAATLAIKSAPGGQAGKRLRDHYRREYSPEYRELFTNLETWKEEQAAIDRAIPTTMVAKEAAKTRETYLLMRGEYDKPKDKVEAGVPSILPALPKGAPSNRLGLAQWLVDPSHPLMSRVVVNRFWQQVFGVGIVKTAEDFGVQGERPSHPELLDWLSTEFVRSHWDVKHMMRLMVTSAAYRQSTFASEQLRALDPENRLLARGPRFRVEGEVVRDTALFVGGLMVERIGGHSVKPFEPPGLWEAVSFNNSQKYVVDKDEGQYRRSLYTNWKRQSPPPSMLIFDAPTREYCVVRRPRTNTPLQALAMLNDPQIVEASRGFAWRMLTSKGTSAEARLAFGFRAATGRPPTRAEVRVLRRVLEEQRAEFRKNPGSAKEYLGVGSYKPKENIEPEELAAWTVVANMIINLDETITKG